MMKSTKSRILISIVLICIINLFVIKQVAAYENKIIKIDGEFQDWDDKPIIYDEAGDAPISQDIHQVKFFVSDQYLFLKINKSSNYKLKENWNFEVLMVDTPRGEKVKEYIYKDKKLTPVNVSSFQVSVYETKRKGKGEFAISVSKDKVLIETTFSVSKDGGELEFRLPLNLVGIQGPSKNIRFIIKSNLNAKSFSEIEFVPNAGVTLISMVPTLGSVYVELFIFLVIVVVIKKYRLRKKVL